MLRKIQFYVKGLGLGLIFLGVSAVAMLLGVFFFRNPGLNRLFFRTYAKIAFPWLGLKVHATGTEVLGRVKPCIYMANHQSGIDLVTIGMLCPTHTLLVGKKELLWIPFFGAYFWLAGNVFINRRNRSSAIHTLAAAVRAMRERKWSLAIMPEGTRNTTDQPFLPFKKGGFHVAIETQLPIIPVVSAPIRHLVDFGRQVLQPGLIRVSVGEPIATQGMAHQDVDLLIDRVRQAMLAQYAEVQKA